MSLKACHPSFTEMLSDWTLCRDSMDEKLIKLKTAEYLPPTSGHILDGYGISTNSVGQKAYDSYLARAVYPDIYSEAVSASVGIMHREPPTFELTPKLEGLLQRATRLGEPLDLFLRRINTEQLISGRVGILADIVVNPQTNLPEPILVLYKETAIRNWNDNTENGDSSSLSLVILDDSGYTLSKDFTWELEEKYLVLALRENETFSNVGVFSVAKGKPSDEPEGLAFMQPNVRGSTLDRIPFVCINAKDLNPIPDQPPLVGLARQCLSIYRSEADYRHSLFMQGQDTLVKIGGYGDDDETTRIGAGSSISVPIGGDAKFIGVNSQGLPEQRQALENDYKRAQSKAGQVTDATSRAKESGDALRIRVAAQSATLPQIAQAGAAGLQKVLRDLAVWFGEDPEKVIVKPNLNFTNEEFQGQTYLQLTQAKVQGAPVSIGTLHNYIRERGITNLTLEEELAAIQDEGPSV